jgi:U3 small nucleolar RNA-associated protein 7
MIALDPEFLGGFAPQSHLSEGVDRDTMSFSRQPRLHRLRVQGKADETEDASENEAVVDCPADSSNPSKRDRMGQGKRKMRGKDKSLKRFVNHLSSVTVRAQLGSR